MSTSIDLLTICVEMGLLQNETTIEPNAKGVRLLWVI